MAGTQPLHVPARLRGGDPLALAARHGGATVEAGAELDRHLREGGAHPLEEAGVQGLGLGAEQAEVGLDARLGEHAQAAPPHLGIGIHHGGDHPGHPGLDQRLGTGRGATVMGAGLQGHIGGGAASLFPGGMQGIDLGMGFTGTLVPALPHHHAGLHQHGAHTGIGGRGVTAATGQLEGPAHPLVIVLTKHLGSRSTRENRGANAIRGWLAYFSSLAISSPNSRMSSKLR
ncbi:hypothetical protein D3C76_563120 [compost metagenome]